MTNATAKTTLLGNVSKFLPALASTMAALTTVVSFLYSYGVLGNLGLRRGASVLRANWVTIAPVIDTAFAIGDTLHLAATASDKSGAVIVGTHPTWTSEAPGVATVESDGRVIARGPGVTVITVAVDAVTARARIIVKQQVAAIRLDADSVMTIAEGARYLPRAVPLDARDNPVRGRAATWTVDDTSVALVDSGRIMGLALGRTRARVSIDGVSATADVNVLSTPAAIVAVGGATQHAAAGSTLAQPVVVRVTSARARPVQGAKVRFRPADGSGRVDSPDVKTDAEGRARTTWTLGDLPGEQTLLASVEGVDSTVAVIAEADPVAANTRVSALQPDLAGAAAAVLPGLLGVRVTDSTGRLLPDVPVAWLALDGGSVEPLAARTDSLGEARARWTLGPRSGVQRMRVHVGSGRTVPPLVIAATAGAGAPRALALVSGDRQRGAAGASLSKVVALKVLDSLQNPVPDVPVALTLATGTSTDSVLRTDSSGVARFRWTLGKSAGPQSATARVKGVAAPVKLSAVATASDPVQVNFIDAPERSRAGKALAKPVTVEIADVFGNPVPDAKVRFSVSGGRLSTSAAVTDAKGRVRVRWTLPSKTGDQSLTARVLGTSTKGSVTVEATGAVSARPAATARPAAGGGPKRSSPARAPKRSARPR